MQNRKLEPVVYKVVVNHEEQYSIWPSDREPPLGWKDAGKKGAEDDCLNFIKKASPNFKFVSLDKEIQKLK